MARYGTLTKDWGPHPKGKTVSTSAEAQEGTLLVDPLRFEALIGYGYLSEAAAPAAQPTAIPAPTITEDRLRVAVADFFGDPDADFEIRDLDNAGAFDHPEGEEG